MRPPNSIVAIFGLETTDIAFLGLLFGILSAVLGPLTYFLINVSKNISYLMRYTKDHEGRDNKEADILDTLVTKLAVIDNRIQNLESAVFRHNRGPI